MVSLPLPQLLAAAPRILVTIHFDQSLKLVISFWTSGLMARACPATNALAMGVSWESQLALGMFSATGAVRPLFRNSNLSRCNVSRAPAVLVTMAEHQNVLRLITVKIRLPFRCMRQVSPTG